VEKIMNVWKSDPINNLKLILRNLDNDYIELDSDTQKLLNSNFINSDKKTTKITIELNEDQEIQNGKEIKGNKKKIKEK
jgi:hypothetical protein